MIAVDFYWLGGWGGLGGAFLGVNILFWGAVIVAGIIEAVKDR